MKRESMRLLVLAALIISLSFVVSGCSKKTVQVDKADETVKVEEATGDNASATGGDSGQMVESAEITEGMGPAESLESPAGGEVIASDAGSLDGRTSPGMFPVYFDFDRSFIREDQIVELEKNAAFMKENPQVNVAIEGNCDERGTNEYNMALGERRAMSAKKYLVNLGIEETRLNTISYGEERPINRGHDELSWSQNRRDDFVVTE
ncbi:MAG: peptidoglycan-associated lipoprotein Pal [Proteobacteria bacterium]|nr:peptidoglycan-associated lipoprotein Pal [Pseudomonadota bacterium]MBU1739268.1 peptidoglycan-associated lipoprotein Pal [Pseudomonadota bacterium]